MDDRELRQALDQLRERLHEHRSDINEIERVIRLLQNAELERNTRERLLRERDAEAQQAISRREAMLVAIAVACLSPFLTVVLTYYIGHH